MVTAHDPRRRLAVEAAAFGIGYASVLCWAGAALVASFGGGSLSSPYWPDLPWLRTDTTGAVAFALAAVSLSVSRYLRLRRGTGASGRATAGMPAGAHAVQAVAETAAVLGTALVAYLSVNAVTHYATLRLQLTHLWPWPSEGTARVIALLLCAVSVAVSRYLRALAGRAGQGRVRADGAVGQVEQAAPHADLEPRPGR